MHMFRVVWLSAIIVAATFTPASAQSFFENLFGLGSKPADLPPSMPSYRAPIHVPQRSTDDRRYSEPAQSRSQQVRTMCVRMCDGYYFPLSNETSIRNLSAESARCKASCNSDARLYYTTSKDPEPGAMVDLTGRRYDAMETAFSYRKTLVPGCTCKLPPWSASERQRHTNYALEKVQKQTLAASDVDTPLPQAKPETQVSDQISAVATTQEPKSARAASLPRPKKHNVQPQYRTRKEIKQRDVVASRRERKRYTRAEPKTGFGNFFGLGGNTQVWPGDAR